MRTNNFFSLSSMLKLYKQLHNKPTDQFSTVGEAIKWRDHLIKLDEVEAHKFCISQSGRASHLERLKRSDSEGVEHAIAGCEKGMKGAKEWYFFERGKREADIRAIQTFLQRCGLSV